MDESEQPLVDETEERDPLVASVGSSKAKGTKAAPCLCGSPTGSKRHLMQPRLAATSEA